MMRRALAATALTVVLALVTLPACDAPSNTSTVEAKALVQGGALLVDVRSPEEYQSGHIEGAVNIPIAELENRIGELTPPEQPIVVYCRSGARSGQAQQRLEQRGFTRVHNLGPMSAWK